MAKPIVALMALIAMASALTLGTADLSAKPRSTGLPRLAISDLDYQGAFRLPDVGDNVSRLTYSSGRMALGADGSTLFIAGFVEETGVAEFPMAELSQAETLAELPLAGAPLQSFVDLVERAPTGNPQHIDRYGGMLVVDGALIVNGYQYYDAPGTNDHTTLAVSDATRLADSPVEGWARMNGAAHAAGWMSPIPQEWQATLGGTHISGSSSGMPIISRASVGPSAFVVDLDRSLSSVSQARPLLDFSLGHPLHDDLYNESRSNDLWTHKSRAVYGFVVPGTRTYLTIGTSAGHRGGVSYGVSPYSGYKGYYTNQPDDKSPYYWLWDVNDMVDVANGLKQPDEIRPYDHGALEIPFADFSAGSSGNVGGAAFDPETSRLYISLAGVDDSQGEYSEVPLIVAFDIGSGTREPTTTTSTSPGEVTATSTTPTTRDPAGATSTTTSTGNPTDGGDPGGSDGAPAAGDDPGPTTGSGFCPSYESSPLHRPRQRQISVGPDDDWEAALANAEQGTEVLLEDGEYRTTNYAVYLDTPGVTIRGASGNRDAVVIHGQGYGVASEGLMVAAADITIADLTMTGMRDHAISIKGEAGASRTQIYNVHLLDIGTQHIKATAGDDNRDGVVACSAIGYREGAVRGDYIGAIDLHGSIDWVIRDNYIYNLTGDGTGCNVDQDCGTYVSGPAILIWNGSHNAVIERNTIVDSWRGITLGLGSRYDGGTVRNNFIYRARAGDAGIELHNAHGVVVEHNTVIVAGYRGAVEYGGSSNIVLRNNLVSAAPLDRPERGESTGVTITGNIIGATAADLVDPAGPHLPDGSRAIGAGEPTDLATDFDGDARTSRWDVGADQHTLSDDSCTTST